MARRYLVTPDRRCVTISTLKSRLLVCNAFVAFGDLRADIAAVTRAGAARLKRHIGVLHFCDIRILRYPDVARRAVFVCVICRLVAEFHRVTLYNILLKIRRRQGVAARTVRRCRFDILVVARKTGRMRIRPILKKLGRGFGGWCKNVRCRFA